MLHKSTAPKSSSLGSHIGPRESREAFPAKKIDKQLAKLARLEASPLPYQHRLLLLRQCLQQDLRHLRSLNTTDLAHQWDRLDKEHERQISLLCPHPADKNSPASNLLKLPLRHGGTRHFK